LMSWSLMNTFTVVPWRMLASKASYTIFPSAAIQTHLILQYHASCSCADLMKLLPFLWVDINIPQINSPWAVILNPNHPVPYKVNLHLEDYQWTG
jgi:hypothetical protein